MHAFATVIQKKQNINIWNIKKKLNIDVKDELKKNKL